MAGLLRQDWQLLSLDLSHVQCSQQGMEAIAEGLLCNKRLARLNLEGNKRGYNGEPWIRSVPPPLSIPPPLFCQCLLYKRKHSEQWFRV